MNLANSQTGQMQTKRQLPVDSILVKEAVVHPRGTDGTDV